MIINKLIIVIKKRIYTLTYTHFTIVLNEYITNFRNIYYLNIKNQTSNFGLFFLVLYFFSLIKSNNGKNCNHITYLQLKSNQEFLGLF